jgi:hypothetical protein
MLDQLIALPLRLAEAGARIGFGLAESALRRGADLLDALASDDDALGGPTVEERPTPMGDRVARPPSDGAAPAVSVAPDAPPITPPSPAPPIEEPVSEEPVLAGSTADPGAEDGASAELEVEPPWPGYRRMKVSEIADRIASADAATLAVLALYERQNADRKGVRSAVDQRLDELEHERVTSS